MDTPVPDAELTHLKEIGLTSEDSVVRKGYIPDQIKAEDEREFTFVISTGAVDRDNDTIKVSGWDLENYRKNPVVLFGHRSDIPPIAKAVSVTKSSGVLKARLQFPPEGVYDLADTVHGLVKGGYMGSTSVGFKPKRDKYAWNEERGGIDFEEQELLEFSLVNVPSNPQALMSLAKDFAGASAAGIDLGPIRKALALADVALSEDGKSISAPATWIQPPADLPLEKAGRRLSAKTEQSLRSAHKSASEAVEHLNSVLERAEDEMEDGKAEPTKPVLYVTPAKSEPVFLVKPDNLKAAVVAAVTESVRSEIDRLRGRLD